jgi:hypothetical protein
VNEPAWFVGTEESWMIHRCRARPAVPVDSMRQT